MTTTTEYERVTAQRARILGLAPILLLLTVGRPVTAVEFQVNSHTTSDQFTPAVATAADGDFVVVWASFAQDGSDTGIFGQRYTSAGTAIGTEFRVNTYTTGRQSFPVVASDADGDFVVAWSSSGNFLDGQDGYMWGVFGQRYASSGLSVGSEFRINTYTTNAQNFPAIAAAANGDFVVVWQSYAAQDGSNTGVFAQRYASSGAAIGAEFQLNAYTTGEQRRPAVAAAANGDFSVVWTGDGPSASFSIFGQRYDSGGARLGAEFQINTSTTQNQYVAALAADRDGNFVVVWTAGGPSGTDLDVWGRRYASSGLPVGTEFRVNTYTTAAQESPAVAADAGGNFLVVWDSEGQDGAYQGIFGQRYASSGARSGTEFQVNSYTSDQQVFAAAAADSGDHLVIVWGSGVPGGQDGERFGIFGRILTTPKPPLQRLWHWIRFW